MASSLKEDLRGRGFRGDILVEQPLSPMTTWRIGGPAELLAIPLDVDDVICAVAWAGARDLAWRVLGNGSNLLVRDAGVRGLVVRLRKVLDEFTVEGASVVAGAGASFPGLAKFGQARQVARRSPSSAHAADPARR
jgi:UDP-N-acetylmuramate dehydrogenase